MNLKISKHPKIVRFVSIMSSKIMTYLLICHKSAIFHVSFLYFRNKRRSIDHNCFENLSGGPKFFVFQGRMIDSTKKSLSRFKFFLTSKKLVLGTTSNFRQGLLQNKLIIYSLLGVFRCYEHFENGSIRKSVTSRMFHCGNEGLSRPS